jgi:hypothetical protein
MYYSGSGFDLVEILHGRPGVILIWGVGFLNYLWSLTPV